MLTIRTFQPQDTAALEGIFDGNCPRYFAEEEKPLFLDFLATNTQPYFVIEDAGAVVAAGGYAYDVRDGRDVVVFCWGMVVNDAHRKGYGTILSRHRLQAIAREGKNLPVWISTSQLTAPFYQKLGFEITGGEAGHFSPTLDLVLMEMQPKFLQNFL